MRAANKKTIILLICLLSILLVCGCTNWKKKYENQLSVSKNLEGLLDFATKEKDRLTRQLTQNNETIEDLRREIDAQQRTPGGDTGFEDYDFEVDAAAGTITVTLQNKILFNSGKAALKMATSAELDHIQSVLRSKYGGKQIDVVGHTDSDPIKKSKWKDNWELSAQRALSVVGYLVKRGMPEDKIRAVGCGAARPVASNSTAQGKAKNRRVEIVVYMR